jgi:acyl carrier protein
VMLSRQNISDKLADYFEELFETPRIDITPGARLSEDLGLDSIDAVDLVVKLQDLTGRRIKPDEYKNVRTVGDIIDCIQNVLVEAAILERFPIRLHCSPDESAILNAIESRS